MVSLFIRAPFYVLLVFIAMCAVFWLFWLSYQVINLLARETCLCTHSFGGFINVESSFESSFELLEFILDETFLE